MIQIEKPMVKLHWFFWQQWTPSCATKIRFYRLPLFLHVFATLGSWCLWAALEISGHLRCAAPPCCWWHQWCHVFVNKKKWWCSPTFPQPEIQLFHVVIFPQNYPTFSQWDGLQTYHPWSKSRCWSRATSACRPKRWQRWPSLQMHSRHGCGV